MYATEYHTPIVGKLTLTSDGKGLTGCWFEGVRRPGPAPVRERLEGGDDLPALRSACAWLDRYFAGERPDPLELALAAPGTEFQLLVRDALLAIPYGQTTTYGAIARELEVKTGRRQSARAVGGVVGRNPLCVIVPCHRVVGSDGSLTGFAGGLERKVALLEHEHALGPGVRMAPGAGAPASAGRAV